MSNRDPRLEQALELLAAKPRPRNGAMPLLAVTGFALTGAMLIALVGPEPEPVQPPAGDAPAVAAAPPADFQLAAAATAVEH